MQTVGVVGLGYVGLPLAVAFGQRFTTIGFDLNEEKLEHYRRGRDPSGEVGGDQLQSAQYLSYTSEPQALAAADIIIIVVPTPIDVAHQPDLSPLAGACEIVARVMRPGTTVVFESTVYPGCTEEYCVPILEAHSGLSWAGRGVVNKDCFYVGYSPERINPGDKLHRLETIVKVVAGDTQDTLKRLADLYGAVVTAGVYSAATIKVAEAAKVIENTQRDLNIALMNELAIIFNRLDIDTLEVLEAAGTKWNFLPFRPGLVGGHCIGVDPYYLTYKAEAAGHHPQVILAGRHINDGMGKFVAEQTVKKLLKAGKEVNGAKVVVLGLTFKEDCPDLRNSKVVDIIRELADYQCDIKVHDPLASAVEAQKEYGIELCSWDDLRDMDAVVLAVPHRKYKELNLAGIQSLLSSNGVLIDVKSMFDKKEAEAAGLAIWRL